MRLRNRFQNELKLLHKDLMKMSNLIEESMCMTIEALESLDEKKANEVIMRDDEVDTLESKIEASCITIIYKQQPVASDLRAITSVLKIITDLERIADICSDICKYIVKLKECETDLRFKGIKEMAETVKSMLTDTINCFVTLDSKKAIETARRDDRVDNYFHDLICEIQNKMSEGKDYIMPGTFYLFIIKYLERMADHITNVCEWIAYRVTGEHVQYN